MQLRMSERDHCWIYYLVVCICIARMLHFFFLTRKKIDFHQSKNYCFYTKIHGCHFSNTCSIVFVIKCHFLNRNPILIDGFFFKVLIYSIKFSFLRNITILFISLFYIMQFYQFLKNKFYLTLFYDDINA